MLLFGRKEVRQRHLTLIPKGDGTGLPASAFCLEGGRMKTGQKIVANVILTIIGEIAIPMAQQMIGK